jgi:hypothetical protein
MITVPRKLAAVLATATLGAVMAVPVGAGAHSMKMKSKHSMKSHHSMKHKSMKG